MRKRAHISIILILLLLILLTSPFAQTTKLGDLLLENKFELLKDFYNEDFYSNVLFSITYLLEDNISQAWRHWKKSIEIKPNSPWHQVIGLLGYDLWDSLPIYKEIITLLRDKDFNNPYLEYLYWKALLSQNLVQEAEKYSEEKGFIKDFLFLGPFENIGNSGLYKEYPPEKEINLEKTYQGKNGIDIKWFTPEERGKNAYTSIYNLIYPNQWAVSYALCYFYVPQNQDIYIRIGTTSSYKLFLDDFSFPQIETQRRAIWNQEIYKTKLSSGWHKLLLKLCNQEGDFGFFLRVTDSRGNKIPGLKTSLVPQNYKRAQVYFERITPEKELIKESDSSEIFYTFYGFLLFEKGLTDEAEEYLKRAEKIKQNSSIIKFILGKIYLDSQEELGKSYLLDSYSISKNLKINLYYLSLYELEHGRYEEALKYLEKEDIPENSFLLRSLLIRLFNALSWTKESEDQISTLEKKYKESQETYFLKGKMYEKRNMPFKAIENYLKALSMNWENWEVFYNLFYLARDLHKYDIVETLAKNLIDKDPTDVWAYSQLISIYLSQERIDEAQKLIEKAKNITYLYPETFIYEAEIYNLKDEKELAMESYQKAISIDPSYKGIREYLNYLRSEQIRIPDISEYITQKVPEEFLDFPAIYLLDRQERIMQKDGSFTVVFHKIIKILKDEAKEKYGEILINYDSSFEDVRILRARTIKPDGKEIEATSIQDFAIASDYPLYTDQRQIVISMPSVEKGSILECFYVIDEYTRSIFGKNFQDIFFFQNEIPILRSIYTLKIPSQIDLKYKVYNGKIEPQIKEDKEYKILTWEMENVPGIIEEPYMPDPSKLVPQLWITTFESWESLADWYYSLAYPQIRSDKNIKEKVKELTSGAKTEEEKIKSIYYFVTNQVRYVGLEYGIRGIMPHSAPEIFKAKYGDCKDKAILLLTMLKEAGIKAYYTLVSTRYSLPLKKELPGFQFDHAIVALPYKNSYLFLDGTAEDVPFGEVPMMDQGADAMIIINGKPLFTKIPMSKSEDNLRKYDVEINIEDGKLSAEVLINLTGYFANYYRYYLKTMTTIQKENFLSRLLNYYIPNSKLTDWDIQNLSNLEEPLLIKLRFENPYLISNKKDINLIKMFPFTSINSAEEISKEERVYDIEYYLPYKEVEDITIKIPKGVNITTTITEIIKENDWISYLVQVERKENILHLKRVFVQKEILIPVQNFKEYKKDLEEIMNYDRGMLLIKTD
ncbi:DUF3857 domain-containing protein [Dictyoglomus thermophilum]|uniref:DUF3857 domain-containing protein n=1 Tax=Dictyoglomus thermophilum TaxID=14 RepID=A0A7V4DXD7_DICTH|nr:DUF3857 domain-containing protein [Dictyoglomus thermophilum]TYT23240.1 DUF3857 domain-containing protein [Dictyoglomus thermophilum]